MINKNIKYCSIFYDTDKYFGSLGNAYDVDFTTLSQKYFNGKNIGISVVSTFTIDNSIRNSMKFIYKNINPNNLYILVVNKYDDKYYSEIVKNNYLLYEKILYTQQFYLEYVVNSAYPVKFRWFDRINILFIGLKEKFNKSFFYIKNAFSDLLNDVQKEKYINKLKKEYGRYKLIIEMKQLSTGREWENIYERFLITMANIKKNEKPKDYILSNVPITHEVYKTMKNEMIEKKIKGIDIIIATIYNKINDYFSADHKKSTINYSRKNQHYMCEDYSVTINTVRHKALITKLYKINKGEYAIEIILILLLRYAGLSMGGQHWNLPHKLYSYMNTSYNLKLECFASPLNSQLIITDKNARFCSLFYYTDKYFGSYGNLFETNIVNISKDFEGNITMSLFPPNLVDLIYKMIELVDKWFEYVPKLRVFTGLLEWTDFPPMQLLENHKYLKYIKKYNIGEYYFENSLELEIPKILKPGSNPYILYVLANYDLPNDEPFI